MPFVPKETKKKVSAGYKTIYLRQSVIDAVDKIAKENNTSFNNVVVNLDDQVYNAESGKIQQKSPARKLGVDKIRSDGYT